MTLKITANLYERELSENKNIEKTLPCFFGGEVFQHFSLQTGHKSIKKFSSKPISWRVNAPNKFNILFLKPW